VESIHRPVYFYDFYANKRLPLEDIRGNSVILFSGIGDPDSFKDNIIRLGAKVEADFRYPDHYVYIKKDIEDIFTAAIKSGVETVVTTEKDMVKVGPLLNEFHNLASEPVRFLSLRIELKIIKNERELIDRLVSLSKC
jgi:tetraacyldisaccharide 4'-kinase